MKAGPKDTDLTTQEQAHVRTALRFLRTRCGGWAALAKVLKYRENHLSEVGSGNAPVSASPSFRVARLVKVGVDDVLAGRFPAPNTCPHCGHVGPAEEIGEL